MMTTNSYITVVIPTYQRCNTVLRALQALTQQTIASDEYEVVVVIDGSQDGTKERVEQFAAPYRLQALWQPNQGRAAACNAGIAAANGELIVLLDDDMQAAPGFLAAHRHIHSLGERRAVLGAVPIQTGQQSSAVEQFIGAKFNRHLEKLGQKGYPLQLRDFYSGNFSIERQLINDAGGFDTRFKIYGNEDLELFLRLRNANIEVLYSSEALAYQSYTKDFAGLVHDTIAKGKTALLLAQKHPKAFSALKLSTYQESSLQWRIARGGLLQLSKLALPVPQAVLWFIRQQEVRRSKHLDSYYNLALDFFYWLGVQQELTASDNDGQRELVVAALNGESST